MIFLIDFTANPLMLRDDSAHLVFAFSFFNF